MSEKKKKISELEEAADLDGLYGVGSKESEGRLRSFKYPIDRIKGKVLVWTETQFRNFLEDEELVAQLNEVIENKTPFFVVFGGSPVSVALSHSDSDTYEAYYIWANTLYYDTAYAGEDEGFSNSEEVDIVDLAGRVGDMESDKQDKTDNGLLNPSKNIVNAINDLYTDTEELKELVPAQASGTNKLVDKAFMNSTVQTNTANFRGNHEGWDDVPADAADYPEDYTGSTTPTNNDYLVVRDASDYTEETLEGTWRFKYSGNWAMIGKSGWRPEYQVNETPLTAEQLAALNSGITQAIVQKIASGVVTDVQVNGVSKVVNGVARLSDNVLVAEYGVTPYATIKAAFDAGKKIVVKGTDSGNPYIADNLYTFNNDSFWWAYLAGRGTNAWGLIYVGENDVWYNAGVGIMQPKSEREDALTPTATNRYPSSKAVADYVDAAIAAALNNL